MGHVTIRMPVSGLVWSLITGLLLLLTTGVVGMWIGRTTVVAEINEWYVDRADSVVARADSIVCSYGGVCE